MSNTIVAHSARPAAPVGVPRVVAFVLVLWFVLVLLFGAADAFVRSPGAPPLPIAFGATLPLVSFAIALAVSRRFRDFVLALDVRLMLGVQAWRFAGFVFLALYAYGVLPGGFALPAGLGDIAIGATAPWLLLAAIRRPSFVTRKTFVIWNALGILDLVVAVGAGTLSSVFASGAIGEITTAPMAQLPLVIIPVYLVPLFVMMHVAALIQASRLTGRTS